MARKESKPDRLFEKVIHEVLAELSPDLRAALGSVRISVLKRATPEQRERSGLRSDEELFGLFEGYSLKEKPVGEERTFPDRIILYEESLKRYYPDRAELTRQVRKTLLHELGHFFGFSEQEIKERGYG